MAEARARLGELVSQARAAHQPVAISEGGRPVAAIIGAEDLADLEDWAAIARHQADKASGHVTGVAVASQEELEAALDRYEADGSWA